MPRTPNPCRICQAPAGRNRYCVAHRQEGRRRSAQAGGAGNAAKCAAVRAARGGRSSWWGRCRVCGEPATSERATYCAAHKHIGRAAQKAATAAATRARWERWREAQADPSHGGEAARKRAARLQERKENP